MAWQDLTDQDEKRLNELLDELIDIFSSDKPEEKIEIIRDIRIELEKIKSKIDQQ